ncbi:MAG TPA: efflux RND transporter periplasmic adaptor subunit [Ignavibacteriaceae bacterium]|nr:efflux RND transporter periplasmic adaptor subunit [Ignavibacteriaceae bacterium]
MKKKVLIPVLLLAAVVVIVYFVFFNSSSADTNKFVFARITKGDLSTTITSTGTLQAVTTVDVGTQVSGKIDRLLVDFNSSVKKGQLLAILDTTNLALQVRNSQAGIEKAQAQYDISKAQFDRDQSLFDKGYLSQLDYVTSKSNYLTAKATLTSAQNSLAQAKTNLGYAFIYSPIRGKIINRNVEEGQTVAASLSAPTLFTIAEDLSKMQILADVDESDIGQIKIGQKAKFNVQAYPEKEFTGKVVQIRLGSTVVSNVVNYVVVVNADNNDGQLLPGMTATIDFYVEQRNNVLMIPNSALRFQPTEKMAADFTAQMQKSKENLPDSLKQRFQSRSGGQNQSRGQGSKSRGSFWFINADGNTEMGSAVLGLTDGKNTEIVRSRNAEDGMQVITGFETAGETQTTNSNILTPNRSVSRGIRRGF